MGEKTEGQIKKKSQLKVKEREKMGQKRGERRQDLKKKKKKQENICLFVLLLLPMARGTIPQGKIWLYVNIAASQSHPYHHWHQLPERNCNGVQGKEIITTGAKQE